MKIRLLVVLTLIVTGLPIADGRTGEVNEAVADKMRDNVAVVECNLEHDRDLLLVGSSAGFFVGKADHVVTSNRVVDQCSATDAMTILKTALSNEYLTSFQKGKLPPQLVRRLARNPQGITVAQLEKEPTLAKAYIKKWLNDIPASPNTNSSLKLYVAAHGKEPAAPISKVKVAEVKWSSKNRNPGGVDAAVLKLAEPMPAKQSVNAAPNNAPQVNDKVYAVGFLEASAGSRDAARYEPTIAEGKVTKVGQKGEVGKSEKDVSVIDTSASLGPGHAGGPLFNERGEVLGLVTSVAKPQADAKGLVHRIDVVLPALKALGIDLPRDKPKQVNTKTAHSNPEKTDPSTSKPVTDNSTDWHFWGIAIGAVVLLLLVKLILLWRKNQLPSFLSRLAGNGGGKADALRALLRGRAGAFVNITIPIPDAGLVLGRRPDAESSLVFPENSDISQKHCAIAYSTKSQRFEVTDLGSSNGTFVIPGEKRLSANEKALCKAGQIIRLGKNNEFELVLR